MAYPIPRLAPVTKATLSVNSRFITLRFYCSIIYEQTIIGRRFDLSSATKDSQGRMAVFPVRDSMFKVRGLRLGRKRALAEVAQPRTWNLEPILCSLIALGRSVRSDRRSGGLPRAILRWPQFRADGRARVSTYSNRFLRTFISPIANSLPDKNGQDSASRSALQNYYLRSDLKPARTSSEKSCGCSQAAKWPPFSTSL